MLGFARLKSIKECSFMSVAAALPRVTYGAVLACMAKRFVAT